MKRSQESARRGGGGGGRKGGAKKLPRLSPLHPKFPRKPAACRMTCCKSSIRPYGGAYFFFFGGGEGLFNIQFRKDDSISSSYRTGIQSGKVLVQDVGGHAAEDQQQIQTSSW